MQLYNYSTKYYYSLSIQSPLLFGNNNDQELITLNIPSILNYHGANSTKQYHCDISTNILSSVEQILDQHNIDYFINYEKIFYVFDYVEGAFRTFTLCTATLINKDIFINIFNNKSYNFKLQYQGHTNLIIDSFAVYSKLHKFREYLSYYDKLKVLILYAHFKDRYSWFYKFPTELIYRILTHLKIQYNKNLVFNSTLPSEDYIWYGNFIRDDPYG